MSPKLNPQPVAVSFGQKTLRIPREKIAAAYAGAWAAKEGMLREHLDHSDNRSVKLRQIYPHEVNMMFTSCFIEEHLLSPCEAWQKNELLFSTSLKSPGTRGTKDQPK